jgi:hypothetical protein
LNRNGGKKADRAPSAARTRHRRRNFTVEVYGARLPYEDARVIDDYAKANKLDRSEVVRQGLHQFALRQQMRYHKKDPLRESLEQVVAEQLAPVRLRTEEMMTLLNDIADFVVEQSQGSSPQPAARDAGRAASAQNDGTPAPPVKRIPATQRELIERTLLTAALVLRLLVDYLIDPALRADGARAGDEVAKRLEAAIRGRERWSRTTHKVVARTGKRMLFESKLMAEEEWERLLAEFRAEDREEGMR